MLPVVPQASDVVQHILGGNPPEAITHSSQGIFFFQLKKIVERAKSTSFKTINILIFRKVDSGILKNNVFLCSKNNI